jgi:hypothetical protein
MTNSLSLHLLINNALLLCLITVSNFSKTNHLTISNISNVPIPECKYYYSLNNTISNLQKEIKTFNKDFHVLYISSIKISNDLYFNYITKFIQLTQVGFALDYFCEANSLSKLSKIVLLKSNKVLYYKNIPNHLEPIYAIKKLFNELIYAKSLFELNNEIGK